KTATGTWTRDQGSSTAMTAPGRRSTITVTENHQADIFGHPIAFVCQTLVTIGAAFGEAAQTDPCRSGSRRTPGPDAFERLGFIGVARLRPAARPTATPDRYRRLVARRSHTRQTRGGHQIITVMYYINI